MITSGIALFRPATRPISRMATTSCVRRAR